MDRLIDLLTANGYSRTDHPISKPLVIHAVAGAGKTTLIRQFLKENPAINAQTLGTPDKPNLSRKMIRPHTGPKANHFNILDEYCAQPLKGSWDAVFADPLQHPDYALEPHFIKETSHRLGPSTCRLISELGILIYPGAEDQLVTRKGVFEGELYGCHSTGQAYSRVGTPALNRGSLPKIYHWPAISAGDGPLISASGIC